MIVRKTNSQRAPLSAREPRLSVPTADSRGKDTDAIGKHCPVASEAKHEISHDAPHGTVVMIGVGGGVSLPFLHFHAPRSGEQTSPSQPQQKRCP